MYASCLRIFTHCTYCFILSAQDCRPSLFAIVLNAQGVYKGQVSKIHLQCICVDELRTILSYDCQSFCARFIDLPLICAVDVRTLSRQGTSLSSHWRDIADMASASDIGDPSPLKAAGSSGPFPPLPAPQRPFGSALEGLPAAYKRAGLNFWTKEQPPAQAMPTAYTLISGRPEFTNALASPRQHCCGSLLCVLLLMLSHGNLSVVTVALAAFCS